MNPSCVAIQYGFISVDLSDVLKGALEVEAEAGHAERHSRDAKRRKEVPLVNSSKELASVAARVNMPEISDVSLEF